MTTPEKPEHRTNWRGHGLPALADLETLSSDELVQLIMRFHDNAPARRMSRELMIRAVAFQVQLVTEGHPDGPDGLSVAKSRNLRRAARRVAEASRTGGAARPLVTLDPGTRLVREWRGEVYEVVVQADDRFLFQGKVWRSLSEIARAITGTVRSGPLFFGLRKRAGRSANA